MRSLHAISRHFSSLQKLKPNPSLHSIRKQFESIGEGSVELSRDKDSALIRLRNPRARNGLSGRMMAQLWEVLEELRLWPQGKSVVLCGADGFFCSGGDLTTVRRIADSDNGRKMSLLMQDNLARLQTLPMVSVAVIEGMAIGGGAEVATAADFRLMSASARIGFVHIRLGITSAWGGGSRLSQLVGPQKALHMMLSGRRLDAEEALRLGLVDDVIAAEADAVAEGRAWIHRLLAARSHETIQAVKEIVNCARFLPLELSLREELDVSCGVWGASEHQRALAANIKHK
ncbi:unnamed protein product [Medioppia subpectinata]|uniref:Ethylmalonyl-CoA decarboxylase n=1 Tax=Medioppia subpectinata TaxID=1979941 RepID=A0A7R9LAN1_9ACAR|nr:unnamed protein product [Medioppia subpectinata]CAG2117308.1 unnamed protein product [Medioppia subpectinata]